MEQEEFRESPEALNTSVAILSNNFVDSEFVSKTSTSLLRYDLKSHITIIAPVISLNKSGSISRQSLVEDRRLTLFSRARSLILAA